jgi:glyoxylase-like metal-dependent hydrolase (beta-lactamase superfamily II)
MNIDTLAVGAFEANCYLLTARPDCVVIDPGGDADRLLAQLSGLGVVPSLILLTHGHPDHIAAACALREATGARVLIHEGDRGSVEHPHPYMAQLVGGLDPCPVDDTLTDGQQLEVGEISLRALHTPGHSPGCVCFLAPGVAFTGDTLFAGSVGRTDLPGGDWDTLAQSLKRLIAETTPETVVYSGHGPASTMAEEIAHNPYLQELG